MLKVYLIYLLFSLLVGYFVLALLLTTYIGALIALASEERPAIAEA